MNSDSSGNATYRTNCDDCGTPLYGTEGFEAGHGSYCDHCSQDYRYEEAETER